VGLAGVDGDAVAPVLRRPETARGTNSLTPEALLTDDGIYYPRFTRLTRCP
jgi:hypothetical protein